jgi:hypothetical protein
MKIDFRWLILIPITLLCLIIVLPIISPFQKPGNKNDRVLQITNELSSIVSFTIKQNEASDSAEVTEFSLDYVLKNTLGNIQRERILREISKGKIVYLPFKSEDTEDKIVILAYTHEQTYIIQKNGVKKMLTKK